MQNVRRGEDEAATAADCCKQPQWRPSVAGVHDASGGSGSRVAHNGANEVKDGAEELCIQLRSYSSLW